MDSVLEVLYLASENLNHRSPKQVVDDGDFQFGSWQKCTCGHIYAAALGKSPFLLARSKNRWHHRDAVTSIVRGYGYGLAARLRISKKTVSLYEQALEAIVDANGLREEFLTGVGRGDENLPHAVSDATVALALRWYKPTKDEDGNDDYTDEQLLRVARRLVKTTIKKLERQQEKDRLAVLAEAS